MLFKYSIRLIVILALILFTFACDSSPQKTAVEENNAPAAKAEVSEAPSLTITVEVTGGAIEGVENEGIFSYQGIPFAAPPVRDLRWKSPQPVVPWEGVKKVNAYASSPIQDTALVEQMGGKTEISEDCLYLNVWTGAKNTDEKRPVMVWIYGGGFSGGTTSFPTFDGTKLAKKGVVLVSTAYRIGPMGFLAHPELSAESGNGSGCYGIQDQIAGLEWVRDNIAKFGGDPSNVTIFGESAGGISVGMLASSPAAKGLFHHAISESGGAVSPSRGTLETAEEQGKAFLSALGANDIKAARALSPEKIQEGLKNRMVRFWPVADNTTIMENPYSLFEAGKFNDTPILVGTNSHEGRLFSAQKTTSEGFEQMIRNQYALGAEEILKAYPHATDAEATRSAQDVIRETLFAWPTWAWAKLQSMIGKNKAFVYYFDHRTPETPDGADHASEISYVFCNLGGFGGTLGPEAEALSELMSSYWINFARNGDPNGEGLPEWPAFDEKEQQVMYFNGESGARKQPNLEKLTAFDAYYAKVRESIKTE